jgi:hypothetical protein
LEHHAGYFISATNRALIYEPYFAALDAAKRLVWGVDPSFVAGLEPPPALRERLRSARIQLASDVLRVAPRLSRLRRRA